VRQWGRLRHFLVSAGKWFEWRGAMLEFGVRMFGCGGEAVRQRVYSLADEVLAQLQSEDLDGLSPKLVVDVEHVRQHVIHKYLCRRWKVGPLTLAKRVSDISGDRLFVLGVRVWARWY